MLKMTTVVAIALSLALAANPVAAQCTLGVYADAAGTEGLVSPVVGETFDAYVVMFLEGLVNGVGYTLVGENLGDFAFIGAVYGSDGGVNIPNEQNAPYFGGSNVGLGECAIGFNGFPIVVAKYTVLALSANNTVLDATLSVTGNARASDLDPTVPVYSDCNGVEISCGIGPSLAIETPVSGDSESFGAVKSLFN